MYLYSNTKNEQLYFLRLFANGDDNKHYKHIGVWEDMLTIWNIIKINTIQN